MRKMRKREESKKVKRQKQAGSIWNPKNLQKEVHAFGYNFHWKTYLLTIMCVLLLIAAVGVFYQLEIPYTVAAIFVALLLLPVLVVYMYKRMYEQKRFADVADYMEQVLYSFRKERKVFQALRECYDAMPDGMMKQTIGDAVGHMEAGQAGVEDDFLSEALHLIEKRYPCDKLHTVHELLISAEQRGGEVEHSIELMIEDIEVWKRQIYGLQKNKEICHLDCILSIIAGAVFCGLDMYIMNMVGGMAATGEKPSLFELTAVQISSFAFVLLCFYTFYKSSKRLTGDWLKKDRSNEKALQKSYEYVMEFSEEKEQKKSLLMAVPFLIGSIACYMLVGGAASVICLIIAGFLMVQHRISYNMSMKDVRDALYRVFPEWLMDMALLLQTNNVQVSIAESSVKAETILKQELDDLLARIKDEPENIRSYTAFCEKFDVPEISTCMKMLYSISEAGAGDVQVQIGNLVSHVHQMQEQEAQVQNENVSFRMRAICFYPIAGTSAKLLVDMLMGMFLMFQLFQNMA